jgi:hypothetical protein
MQGGKEGTALGMNAQELWLLFEVMAAQPT